MALTFYWYPNCGTCKKAKKWLDDNSFDYTSIHIVEDTPSEQTILDMIDKSGLPAKKFFNTSGKSYREKNIKDKIADASNTELAKILASDGMLIKRPITTDGETITVGFKEEIFNHTWKNNRELITGGILMSLPKDLLYSEEHEWVKKEDGNVRIGITDFAQSELGDIVFVELPEVGDEIMADEPFGSVESVKTVSELYAPISGIVIEVNEDLGDSPEFVNESPYEKAWMVVVEPSNKSEIEELLSPEKYEEIIDED